MSHVLCSLMTADGADGARVGTRWRFVVLMNTNDVTVLERVVIRSLRQGADMQQTLIDLAPLACLVAAVVVLIAGLLKLATQHRRW